MNDPLTTLVNMSRQLLDGSEVDSLDRSEIADTVAMTVPIVAKRTGHAFTSAETDAAIRLLEGVYIVAQGHAISLVDAANRAPDWYLGERRRPGSFMRRYLQKLQEEGWPQRSVDELRDSTARVLELLDDPAREGPWHWKGLVVGDVQSGKTAHYAGVVNRAADAGYKLIIVLAGMHNVLRLQTQQRLETDFLGYDTNPLHRTDGARRAVGVGLIPPRLNVGSLTLATSNGDFNVGFARQANFAPMAQPCLFVVKKNASILKNLNDWIRDLPEELRAAPLLLIDDEADQASIDTRDQPTLSDGTFVEDYEPTRVNREIRRLLTAFDRTAYVGYTATPFANILIHDQRAATKFGLDLFPSTFIVSLSSPDDYFGPVAVFGTNSDDEHEGLPVIRHIDQATESWIPEVHDKTLKPQWNGEDQLPPSLRVAIEDFVIACAARSARGMHNVHNSMLVHVSRFVDVHDCIHAQVLSYLDNLRALISGADRATLERLSARWSEDFERTRASIAGTVFDRDIRDVRWGQVHSVLADSADRIQVIVTNGRAKTGLDYESHKESGLSVIAIGGDKLSRGLTLEGLTVSYFLRVSKQYDSLLQMGRWFGYRRGFADLCRLHTTPDMEDWFRHVATANLELRSQLAHMKLMLKTPKDYGLKVEAHHIMDVTSANKQRHAVVRSEGYAGEGKIQTVMFRERVTLERNAAATDTFLRSLGLGTLDIRRPGGEGVAKGRLWNADGRAVATYLRGLTFPPENVDIEGARLATFIEDQLKQVPPELVHWSVFLAEGEGQRIPVADFEVHSVKRTPLPNRASSGRFIVKSILNPPDEALDLSDDDYEKSLQRTRQLGTSDVRKIPIRPSGQEIREQRSPEHGMLIIYPMDPVLAEVEPGTKCAVIGVVISFPSSETASERVYVENSVLQREKALS
jgi:hypothetical protein